MLPLATRYGTRDNKVHWFCRKGDASLLCGSALLRVVKSSRFGGGAWTYDVKNQEETLTEVN